ncbi:MAG TPA: prepilin-type N-terminal cleavage/methylation domain-containing protein [Gemmatimonadales bacterium]|nr:prepilin-type N-terminal cleavage/methylation domain-containing protein [Gemmatimonadales bacterium]
MRVRRRGATLVELLVALGVTAVLSAATFRLLDRTRRFAEGSALVADAHAQRLGAHGVLRTALEELSPLEGDLVTAFDSSVTFLGIVGVGVACALGSGTADFPPTTLASGSVLASWRATPQAGDVVALLDEGTLAGAGDDRWVAAQVTSAIPLTGSCVGTPFVDSIADAGRSGWRLSFGSALAPTVRAGTIARILRRQRFALYRSGAEWALGWAEWNAPAASWHPIQPLAGPLTGYAPSGTGGLSLQWHDSLGALLPPGALPTAAGVDVTVRAPTSAAVRMDGVTRGVRIDSARTHFPFRNRR